MDDTEKWLLDPKTSLDDIERIANGDDTEDTDLRPRG
jgi:hypothetical protein